MYLEKTDIKEQNIYINHAMTEFQAAGWVDKDGKFDCDMQEAICNHVLKLLEVFAGEGHSGSSAAYTIGLFRQLATFGTISPLTGEDTEWSEIDEDTFQNNRNSAVFKDGKNGRAYFIEGFVKAWEHEPDNRWSGGIDLDNGKRVTRAYIKDFSHMPTVQVNIPVVFHSEDPADWEFLPITREALSEVEKYYDLEIIG